MGNILFIVFSFINLIFSPVTRPNFDEKSAFAFLEKQCSFGPRNPNSTGHAQCRDYLIGTLEKYTANVRRQDFTHFDAKDKQSLRLTNIIASFSGSNITDERILLCAHWDTRPRADQDTKDRDKPIPGANDGASGVAVLLEIARLMKQNPPPISVDIVLFDGEDYGKEGDLDQYLLGSKYFVKQDPPLNYRLGILLDMIGDAELSIPKEGYSYKYLPDYVDRIWNTASYMGITAFEDRVGGEIIDDHRPLIDAGIPCVDLIDFDYKYWHTHEDTPDKCSPASLDAVGEVLLEALYGQK